MIVGYVLLFSFFVLLIILSYWYRDITLHFLNLLDNFKFSGSMKNIATPPEQQLEMLRHISPADVNSLNGIIDGETFEYRTTMADAITAVEDQARGFSSGIQTKDCLLLEKYFGGSKLLEEYVCSLSSIVEWVEWWLRQQNWMLFWLHFELTEDMLPQSFHVVPVLDHSVLNWVS
jgi:hypothetical protein